MSDAKPLGIVELLTRIGDSRIEFQNLFHAFTGARTRKGGGVEVSFVTDPDNVDLVAMAVSDTAPKKTALVLWLPPEEVAKANADHDAGVPILPAPTKKPSDCPHEAFSARVDVNRLLDTGKFVADITIACVHCGEPFRFLGVPAGLHFDRPAVSIDELELRAPIEPQGQPRLQASASFTMPAIPVKH